MHIMASVTAGLFSIDTALASSTHSNKKVGFNSFVRFLNKCGFEKDPLLTKFSRSQKNTITLDFAHSIRFNEHFKTTKSALISGTVKPTIGDVKNTFRENFRRDTT